MKVSTVWLVPLGGACEESMNSSEKGVSLELSKKYSPLIYPVGKQFCVGREIRFSKNQEFPRFGNLVLRESDLILLKNIKETPLCQGSQVFETDSIWSTQFTEVYRGFLCGSQVIRYPLCNLFFTQTRITLTSA